MTLEIILLGKPFGGVEICHKETNYLLARIGSTGRVLKTSSPLIFHAEECMNDEDFGKPAAAASEGAEQP
jgi:hypothetical protein